MATNLLLEGEDLEALLMRAHAEAGPRARIVRASKVRRGGVLGFFARQVFEVAVEVPDEDETEDGEEELLGHLPEQRTGSDPLPAAPPPAPAAPAAPAAQADPAAPAAPAAPAVPGAPAAPAARRDPAPEVVEGVLEDAASLGPAAALAARTVDPMPEPLGTPRSAPSDAHDRVGADDREGMKELDAAAGPLPGTVADRRSAIERAIEQDAPASPEELARRLQSLASAPADDEEPEPARPPFRAGLVDANGREILPASAFISTSVEDAGDAGSAPAVDTADDAGSEVAGADVVDGEETDEDVAIPGVVVYDLSAALVAEHDVAAVVAEVVQNDGDEDGTDEAPTAGADDVPVDATEDDADEDEAPEADLEPADADADADAEAGVEAEAEADAATDAPAKAKTKNKNGKKAGKRKTKPVDEPEPEPVPAVTSVGITVLPHQQGWFPTEGLLNVAKRLSPAERAAARVLRMQAETSRTELAEQEEQRREAEQQAAQEQAEEAARLAAERAERAERGEPESAPDDAPAEPADAPTPEGSQHWWMELEVDERDDEPRGLWSRIAAGRGAVAGRAVRTESADTAVAEAGTEAGTESRTEAGETAEAGSPTATAAIPGQRTAAAAEPRTGAHRAPSRKALAERAAEERALAEQLAAQERALAVRRAADPMAVAEEFVRDEIAEDLDLPHDPAERSRSMLAQLRAGLRMPRHREPGDVAIPAALPTGTPSGLGAAAAVLVSGRSSRDAVVVPGELMAALSGTTAPEPVAGIPSQRSDQAEDEPAGDVVLEGWSADWFPADQIDPLTGEPLPGTPAAAAKAVAVGPSGPVVEDAALVEGRRAARLAEARLAAERRALRALGVPTAMTRRYRGGDRLSAVLAMLERMPQADFDPDAPVVAVIGPAGAVELEAHRTALDLPLGNRPRPVVVVPGSTSPERSTALAQAQQTRPVVVAIERAGLDDVVSVRRALRTAQPDVVIALIDARDRLEDITRWVESFDRVDAIALDCALEVSDPAAVLTLDLPVIRMDGIPVDRFGWATLLCAQLEALDSVR